MASREQFTYRAAGVDIDEADRAVSLIRQHARATFTPAVVTDIGSFGAGYRLKGWKDPVLVSSADGVGTKLKIAFLAGRHDTVGEDLVNHCVNDIAVQGAVPLFFLDYFATGKLDASVAEQVISGIARGCQANGCALIGGETAEMPGFYQQGEYDLAGFIVGAVQRKSLLTGANVRKDDVLLGLPSSGLHTNGFSLVRKLIDDAQILLDAQLTEELLRVHRSYLKPIRALLEAKLLKAAAHITGGGLTENVPRVLPDGLAAKIRLGSWPVLPIFERLRSLGNIPDDDFRRTFNLGIGMVLIVSKRNLAKAWTILDRLGERSYEIGRIISSDKKQVIYAG